MIWCTRCGAKRAMYDSGDGPRCAICDHPATVPVTVTSEPPKDEFLLDVQGDSHADTEPHDTTAPPVEEPKAE